MYRKFVTSKTMTTRRRILRKPTLAPKPRRKPSVISDSENESDEDVVPATSEQAMEMLKVSMVEEEDYHPQHVHIFVILGASVSDSLSFIIYLS